MLKKNKIKKNMITYSLNEFLIREIKCNPNPRLIIANIRSEYYSRIQKVVDNDFHGLFLSHQYTNTVVFLVSKI